MDVASSDVAVRPGGTRLSGSLPGRAPKLGKFGRAWHMLQPMIGDRISLVGVVTATSIAVGLVEAGCSRCWRT